MIIDLRKSILFTTDPDTRFAKEYNLPKGLLKDIYRRYKVLDYTVSELCEFYTMKTGKKTSFNSMERWMWRTDIYAMTKPVIDMGAHTVVSSFFKDHEWRLIKELTKNIKNSVKGETKTLI